MNNILICVSGLTPQIITETFYCLTVQQKIPIRELYIITTARGRDILYGIDEQFNRKLGYGVFKNELANLCKKYKVRLPRFENNDTHIIVAKEQTTELPDIRNDIHNKLFPNKVCNFIREKTNDKENILHCSISGGRKSMSVDLAFALSLFGRENDKLYHVLTDEKLEFKHFYPVNEKEDKQLVISEIPYVRLRPLISEIITDKRLRLKNYTDIVKHTQLQLRLKTADKFYLDKKGNSIRFADYEWVKIMPSEMNLYAQIIESKIVGKEINTITELTERFSNINTDPKGSNVRTTITRLNKKICKAVPDIDARALFVIQGPQAHGAGNYGVYASYDDFKIIT